MGEICTLDQSFMLFLIRGRGTEPAVTHGMKNLYSNNWVDLELITACLLYSWKTGLEYLNSDRLSPSSNM